MSNVPTFDKERRHVMWVFDVLFPLPLPDPFWAALVRVRQSRPRRDCKGHTYYAAASQNAFEHLPYCLSDLLSMNLSMSSLLAWYSACLSLSFTTSYVSSQSRNSGVKYEITMFAPARRMPSVLSNAIVLRSNTPACAAAQIMAYSPETW